MLEFALAAIGRELPFGTRCNRGGTDGCIREGSQTRAASSPSGSLAALHDLVYNFEPLLS